MNLKTLSDSDLLNQTLNLVHRERELLREILQHLKEIERRRLYSEFGYRSLFEYATKKLGYADDQAGRRISAMRLLRELPEIEEKIADGSLTLTNIGLAQTLFRQERKASNLGFSKHEKLELLASLENKSKREAEKIVISTSRQPESLRPDRIRPVAECLVEIKFMAHADLEQKMAKVRGLLAHSHPNMSLAEVIDYLCNVAIERLEPSQIDAAKRLYTNAKASAPALKRRVSANAKRLVWSRAQCRCQNCGSVHALETDHVQPIALGGSNNLENLRLLCRSCNQRAAIQRFGMSKMQRYLDRPAGG